MIQNRDIQIFLTLNEHKVLTTHQVQDLFFSSPKRARERLLRLHRANFIDRFTPPVESGSAPIHHVLGEFGAHLVAGELGIEVKDILRRLNRLAAMSRSQRLKHLVSVNGFFTRLQWACRLTHDIRLSDWWSEERTAREWGEIVRPDGFGRIDSTGRSRSFFVEVDLGTESTARVARKLVGYTEAASMQEVPDVFLFVLPDSSREMAVRRVLSGSIINLATSTMNRHRSNPLGPIWLPVRFQSSGRLGIQDLPTREDK